MNKISKINITNIGSFLNFDWNDSLPDKDKNGKTIKNIFGKNNIFYGDNGNGKSTLVRIFKKINGNENIKLKKNWDNQIDDMKFEFFNGDSNNFDLESTDYNNKFIIFDKDYILKNVGDIVGDKEKYQTDNNKERGEKIIILGGFNEKEKVLKKYDEVIGNLKSKNDKLFSNIKNGGEIINSKLLNKKISDYKSSLDEIESNNIDFYKEQLRKKEEDFTKLNEIIQNFDELKKIEDLHKIDEIIFDKEFYENIFIEPFVGVDFKHQEKDLIKELLDMTEINQLDKCLFCEQEIKNGDSYIDRIQKLFNSFSDKEKEISDGLIELKNIILYLKQENKEIENIHSKNKLNFNKFEKFDNNFEYDENFEIILSESDKKYLNNLLTEINNKNNVKSEIKNINLNELDLLLKSLNIKIKEFNKNIENINKKIEELKKVEIKAKEQEKTNLKNEIDELKNKYFIKNNLEIIKTFFEDYEKYELNKKNIDNIKLNREQYRKELGEQFKKFSEEYGKYIGDVLVKLNSSLQIEKFKFTNGTSNYSQGAGRYGFEIHYNNKNIIGELSEGEKRSIALSYFFAEIEKNVKEKEKLEKERGEATGRKIGEVDGKIKDINKYFDKILILDDPAVDFDIGHKKIIADFIAEYSIYFQQVFVFSHDNLFFNYLKNSFDNYKSGNHKEFWIYKTNGISNIVENNKNVFNKYLNNLNDFIKNGNKDITELYVLTYKLRFCIEKFIKNDVLGFGKPNFNSILTNIGNNKFDIIKDKTMQIKSIYNFCNNNGSHFSDVEGGNNGLKKNIEKFIEIYK